MSERCTCGECNRCVGTEDDDGIRVNIDWPTITDHLGFERIVRQAIDDA